MNKLSPSTREQTMDFNAPFYTVKEIAALAKCSNRTVSAWIKTGLIRPEEVVRPAGKKRGALILVTAAGMTRLFSPPPPARNTVARMPAKSIDEYNRLQYQRLVARLRQE